MLDFSHLSFEQRPQVFYGQLMPAYQVWQKPRGCNFVFIMGIGAGGNGRAGFNAIAAQNAAGGGGGGTGSITRALFPAQVLPDRLFIWGGTTGVATMISISPDAGGSLLTGGIGWVYSGISATAASGGAGASIDPLTTITAIPNIMFLSVAGQAGSAGGSTGPGTNIAFSVDNIVCGGAGGGGQSTSPAASKGGSVVSSGIDETGRPTGTVLVDGGAGSASGSGSAGGSGSSIWTPRMRFFPGAGGGNAAGTAAVGGAGGNGGFGCGGGGGGGSSGGSAVAGAAGRGGVGIVLIWTL